MVHGGGDHAEEAGVQTQEPADDVAGELLERRDDRLLAAVGQGTEAGVAVGVVAELVREDRAELAHVERLEQRHTQVEVTRAADEAEQPDVLGDRRVDVREQADSRGARVPAAAESSRTVSQSAGASAGVSAGPSSGGRARPGDLPQRDDDTDGDGGREEAELGGGGLRVGLERPPAERPHADDVLPARRRRSRPAGPRTGRRAGWWSLGTFRARARRPRRGPRSPRDRSGRGPHRAGRSTWLPGRGPGQTTATRTTSAAWSTRADSSVTRPTMPRPPARARRPGRLRGPPAPGVVDAADLAAGRCAGRRLQNHLAEQLGPQLVIPPRASIAAMSSDPSSSWASGAG